MITRFYRYCLVLGLLLAASSRVQAQAVITAQPVTLTNLQVGVEALFNVEAHSAATTNLAYQWLRNGVEIPNATNSTLGFDGVAATNCGAFSVVVDDGVEAVESDPAGMTVAITLLQGVDNLLNAVTLPVLSLLSTKGTVRSSNVGAVTEDGVPEILPGDPGGSAIWFLWIPLESGVVTLSTLGSDFDTTMGAYTDPLLIPIDLAPVPSAVNDDDSAGYLCSKVMFNATALTPYLIAVDGYFGAQGNVVLSWDLDVTSAKLPSVNNTPAAMVVSNGATVNLTSPWQGEKCDWLLNGAVVATQTNVCAITNVNDATVGSYVARFTTSHGDVALSEPIRVEMNVLQGGSVDTNSAAWNKLMDSAASTSATPSTGKAQVSKMDGGGDGGVYTDSQVFSTEGNVGEPGQPQVCGQNAGSPGWYTYITPAKGTLVINTGGSSFNTVLGVYTGNPNSFRTLTNVGCGYTTNFQAEGQPSVTIPNLAANQTNYIVVEGEKGGSGTVHLNLALGVPITIASPPQSQTVGQGGNVTLAVSDIGSTPLYYSWQLNGTNLPGQTAETLTLSNFQAGQAGTYSVTISNLVSVTTTQAVVSLAAAPSIGIQPASHTVTCNGLGSLSVTATGTPAPAFLWLFNGTAISAGGSGLAIPNFQLSNQGIYTVIVSNNVGAVTSSPAALLLDAPCRINGWGMSNGAFELEVAGGMGSNFVIEGSSDLLNWMPLMTNMCPSGILNFTDSNGLPSRFYRAVAY